MLIVQMVYQSTLARPLDPLTLLGILNTAKPANALGGVTSFMYHDATRVFQVFEGAQQAVKAAMERTAASRLHQNLKTRAIMRADNRSFPGYDFGTTHVDDPVFRQVHTTFANPGFFDLNVLDAIRTLRIVGQRKRRALNRDGLVLSQSLRVPAQPGATSLHEKQPA